MIKRNLEPINSVLNFELNSIGYSFDLSYIYTQVFIDCIMVYQNIRLPMNDQLKDFYEKEEFIRSLRSNK